MGKNIHLTIQPHDHLNKWFMIYMPHITLKVDYDDVDQQETDAAVEVLKEIIEKHWSESLYKEKYKEKLLKNWNDNETNVQMEHDSFEEYIQNLNI